MVQRVFDVRDVDLFTEYIQYQINRSYLISLILAELIEFITSVTNRTIIITRIIKKAIRTLSQVRPNRKFERKKKHPGAKFSQNYKSCI